jgi:hypothetical protein
MYSQTVYAVHLLLTVKKKIMIKEKKRKEKKE